MGENAAQLYTETEKKQTYSNSKIDKILKYN